MAEKTYVHSGKSTAHVELARREHNSALAEFFRTTWDPEATPDGVRRSRLAAAAENVVSPGVAPPAFLFLQDSKVIGYLGSIPVRVWDGTSEQPAYWVKGLMVLPEFRNGPVGFLLLKEAVRHMDCCMALAVLPVVVGLFERLGFTDLGMLQNSVRILRPVRALNRLRLADIGFSRLPAWLLRATELAQRTGVASAAGLCASAFAHLYTTARGGFPGTLTIEQSVPAPSELDALWRRARRTIPAGIVRDSRYLNVRYPQHDSGYQYVAVRRGSEILSLAIVKRPRAQGDPRLNGITVATVSEWIFPLDSPEAGLAALAGAEMAARRYGADLLLCSSCHADSLPLLTRRGYWKVPANVHLLVRADRKQSSLPLRLADWWVTRGDSNADEVF